MKLSKKVAAALISAVLGVTTVAGVGTYAYFNSIATSQNNSITAGTLTLTSSRNDLPINGPMFYRETNSNGTHGDGYWKPGINKVKSILVKNDGNIAGVLKNVKATLLNSNNFTDEEKAMFLRDAKIEVFYAYKDSANRDLDGFYNALKTAQTQLENELNSTLQGKTEDEITARMQTIYNTNLRGYSQRYGSTLTNRHTPLSTYMNGLTTFFNSAPVIEPGDTLALIYHVYLDDNGDQNIIQGKNFEFDFTHEFVQQ